MKNSLLLNDKKFICDFCNTEHIIPENSFPANKAITKLLQINLDKLNRGEAFKNAKVSFDVLNSRLESFELVNKDPAFFIDEYFSDLINKIDIRREELKLEIDNYYDKNIQELNLIKKECIEISEQNKSVSSEEIKYLRNEVDNFDKMLKMLDLDENKWKTIELKSKILINKIEFKLKELKNYFLLGKSYYFKVPKVKLDSTVLGQLEVKPNENMLNYSKEVTKLNQIIKNQLNDGRLKRFKLVSYDEIRPWCEISCDEQEGYKFGYGSLLARIVRDKDQCRYLKLLNEIEKSNSVLDKHYTIVSSNELSTQSCWKGFVYKHHNAEFQHEFLNDFGFAISVKNPKFLEL